MKLFHVLMQENVLLQDNAILLFTYLVSLRELFVFHGLSYILKSKPDLFPFFSPYNTPNYIIKCMVPPSSVTLDITGATTSITYSKTSLFPPQVFCMYFIITDTIFSNERLYNFMYFKNIIFI